MNKISLRKRSNGWEYRFQTAYMDGKQRFQTKSGFASKKAAREAGILAQEEYLSAGILQQNKEISVSDFLRYWMEHYCCVNLKETTQVGYQKKIRLYIEPALGRYMIGSVSPLVLQDFINQMFEKGYSRNTLACVKGILSGSFSYAVSPAGFLAVNPMLSVRLPHLRAKAKTPTRQKERTSITKEEWEKLLLRFPEGHPSHLPLQLGYHLGVRLGEAFALAWEDVDFEKQRITIHKQVQWNQKKQCWVLTEPKYDSVRTISFDSVLAGLLQRTHTQQLKGKAYYAEKYQQLCVDGEGCLGRKGKPIHLLNIRDDGSYIQPRTTQHLNHIAHTQLNMPAFDFHTLRHTHATLLMEIGVNPLSVQERLGHSKLAMTWHYAHNTDALREASEALIQQAFSASK